MVQDPELLQYSAELVRMTVKRDVLAKRLIVETADLQAFESDLFKLSVSEFAQDVTFLKDRDVLLQKVTDESYCESVRAVVSKGKITFYDYEHSPLIQLILNVEYEEEISV